MTIKYDYLPKYCKECKLQGHDELECWKLHLELVENKADNKQGRGGIVEGKGKIQGPLMILSSGKVVDNSKEQWKEVKDN